jgi:hypothetical protein
MKRWILLFAAIGLVGCFLPLIAGVTFWDLHTYAGWRVYAVIAAYLVPLVIALQNDARSFAGALGATASFGYLLYTFGFDLFDVVFHAAIGGIMMGVGAFGGFLASLAALGAARKR